MYRLCSGLLVTNLAGDGIALSLSQQRESRIADKPSADAEEVIREMCVCAFARTRVCVVQFINYCQAYIGMISAHGINIQEITAF